MVEYDIRRHRSLNRMDALVMKMLRETTQCCCSMIYQRAEICDDVLVSLDKPCSRNVCRCLGNFALSAACMLFQAGPTSTSILTLLDTCNLEIRI